MVLCWEMVSLLYDILDGTTTLFLWERISMTSLGPPGAAFAVNAPFRFVIALGVGEGEFFFAVYRKAETVCLHIGIHTVGPDEVGEFLIKIFRYGSRFPFDGAKVLVRPYDQ